MVSARYHNVSRGPPRPRLQGLRSPGRRLRPTPAEESFVGKPWRPPLRFEGNPHNLYTYGKNEGTLSRVLAPARRGAEHALQNSSGLHSCPIAAGSQWGPFCGLGLEVGLGFCSLGFRVYGLGVWRFLTFQVRFGVSGIRGVAGLGVS